MFMFYYFLSIKLKMLKKYCLDMHIIGKIGFFVAVEIVFMLGMIMLSWSCQMVVMGGLDL